MIWKPWPHNPFYEVAADGQVRSKNGVRKIYQNPNGYWYLRLRALDDAKFKTYWLHRVVLEAHVGMCPDGCVAMHRDHDKANNCVENLSWGTQSENVQASYDSGRKVPVTKHSDEDIKEMLRLHREEGWTQQQVADRFNTSRRYVGEVHRGLYRATALHS